MAKHVMDIADENASLKQVLLLLLFIADGPTYILVQRTLAGPMAHLGANTSPLPQARTSVLQPSSCTQLTRCCSEIRSTILLRAFALTRDTIRGGTCCLILRCACECRRSSPFNFFDKKEIKSHAGCMTREKSGNFCLS